MTEPADPYPEPLDLHDRSRDPAPPIEIVQAPHFSAPMPPGKSIHATIKFNVPMAWLDMPEGPFLIANVAAEEARVFLETLRANRENLE